MWSSHQSDFSVDDIWGSMRSQRGDLPPSYAPFQDSKLEIPIEKETCDNPREYQRPQEINEHQSGWDRRSGNHEHQSNRLFHVSSEDLQEINHSSCRNRHTTR